LLQDRHEVLSRTNTIFNVHEYTLFGKRADEVPVERKRHARIIIAPVAYENVP
jgi:hypothetical protein